MEHRIIHKQHRPGVAFKLQDYERIRAAFTWNEARSRLAGLPGGGLNMGYEAVHRQVAAGLGGRVALRCVGADDVVTAISYHAPGPLPRALRDGAGHATQCPRVVPAVLGVPGEENRHRLPCLEHGLHRLANVQGIDGLVGPARGHMAPPPLLPRRPR